MTDNERYFERLSRRTFMKATAAGGVLVGSLGGGFDNTQERNLKFDCGMRGWQGREPSSIAGGTNPTLELEAGKTYAIEWTNVDGFRHNFVILDQQGNQIIRTGYVEEAGQTQLVKFTATEKMTQYMCEVHPATMRGNITIAGREDEPNPYEQDTVIPPGDSIGLKKVADGLNAPLGFETAPGVENRQFVVDQPGQIHVLGDDGVRDEPFFDIGGRIVDLGVNELRGYDERGLLGLAFHPDFPTNRRFFVRYSAPRRGGTPANFNHTEVLAEFEATENLENGIPDSERTLLEIPSPQMNHNGGEILFGPSDGYLYTSIGDGGGAGDTADSGPSPTTTGHVSDWYGRNEGGNGQDVTENLLGSILRIDIDSQSQRRPYGVPEDNPLVDGEGLPEHYAWGFRNPWRMSFDSQDRLFVGDEGQNRFESVYIVEKGGNYGWNITEGSHCFSTQMPSAPAEEIGSCPDSTPDDVRGGEELLDPIIEYPHRFRTTAFVDGSAVIGGHVYEGDALGSLQSKYVLGNWSGRGVVEPDGEIFAATEPSTGNAGRNATTGNATENATAGNERGNATNGNRTTGDGAGAQTDDSGQWPLEELIVEGSPNGKLNRYVYGFGQDQDGELYVLTNTEFRPERDGTGEVYKLVPAGEGERIPDPNPQPDSEGTETADNETDGGGNDTRNVR